MNKIFEILIISISLWFIIYAAINYFLLHTFSLEKFIIATLFFAVCAVTSCLSFFGKVSSVGDIIKREDNKVGDILVGIFGLAFGIIGFYVGISFKMGEISKIILTFGGVIFIIMASIYLLIKFKEHK